MLKWKDDSHMARMVVCYELTGLRRDATAADIIDFLKANASACGEVMAAMGWVTDQALAVTGERAEQAERERDEARGLINRDRTGLANALAGVLKLVQGWAWVGAGEWGSYDYTERTEATLRAEWSTFEEQAVTLIRRALRESGYRADHAFHPEHPDRTEELDSLRARLALCEKVVEAAKSWRRVERSAEGVGSASASRALSRQAAILLSDLRRALDSPVGVAATAENGDSATPKE